MKPSRFSCACAFLVCFFALVKLVHAQTSYDQEISSEDSTFISDPLATPFKVKVVTKIQQEPYILAIPILTLVLFPLLGFKLSSALLICLPYFLLKIFLDLGWVPEIIASAASFYLFITNELK